MQIPEKAAANLSSNLLVAKDIPSRVSLEHAGESGAASQDPTGGGAAPVAMLSKKGTASAAGFRPDYWSYNYEPTPPSASENAVVPLFSEEPPGPAASPEADTASVAAEPTPSPVAPLIPSPEADPAPIAAALAAAAPAAAIRSRGPALVLGLGCLSLVVSGWLYWSSLARPPAAPQVASGELRQTAPPAPANAPAPSAAGNIAVAPSSPAAQATPQPLDPPASTHATAAPTAAGSPQLGAATLSPAAVGALMARGDALLATGDIAAARLFYQRAAEQGLAAAATALGQTFDPLYLEQAHVRGIHGEPAIAAEWYRKASAAGDRIGQARLARLLARFPG
jgi:hypothetical protein